MSQYLLSQAILIATTKHAGQIDKGGNPYILHPIRVALSLSTYEEMIVGVLHDVIEDTDCTYEDLTKLGFSSEITTALECLTKRPGETKIEAAHRAASNRLACAVKIADVTDNMDLSRIPYPSDSDYERVNKYRDVFFILERAKAKLWDNFSDRKAA